MTEGATMRGGTLSPEEWKRYARQIVMPEVGPEGQVKLKQSSVLIVGAGGLGSPAATYLAASGVGRLGILDSDHVDVSNLQRQVLHTTWDINRQKTESAGERLAALNPNVTLELLPLRLRAANAGEIIGRYDIVLDCSDNFPTRYLVNDACALMKRPLVYGSVYRMEGELAVFDARRGPCYRCLYPSPPAEGSLPDSSEGGVIGMLPGVIGALQALEALKLLLGRGEPLLGRMLLLDGMKLMFREVVLKKNPDCPMCGARPKIQTLTDMESPAQPGSGVMEITPEELKAGLDRGDEIFLLDVREELEYAICNLGGYLIPLRQLPGRIRELDPSKEIVVYCHRGVRSARAVAFLQQAGFRKVKNLAGGIHAWATRIDAAMRTY